MFIGVVLFSFFFAFRYPYEPLDVSIGLHCILAFGIIIEYLAVKASKRNLLIIGPEGMYLKEKQFIEPSYKWMEFFLPWKEVEKIEETIVAKQMSRAEKLIDYSFIIRDRWRDSNKILHSFRQYKALWEVKMMSQGEDYFIKNLSLFSSKQFRETTTRREFLVSHAIEEYFLKLHLNK
ncbi:MAG: hypothetical protein HWN80_19700 [Candidatus Lokiarchaeota archaeon]|nr:hypothetical protein [Candidatus Lokiarchaeota archaeon]